MSPTREEVATAMLALKHAMDRIKPAQTALRAQARELLKRKERVTVEMDGEIVGVITKSAPNRQARVSDEAALFDWIEASYPDCIEVVPIIEDMTKAVEALEECAPHLVQYRERVHPPTISKLLAAAEEAGAPVGPGGEADIVGITVDKPDGNVSVIPDDENGYMVERLLTSGQVSLDGVVRPQLEGGAS